MYILCLSFIKLSLKMKELCCLNQYYPHFSVFENWLQANCPGFIETLQIWTSASGLSCAVQRRVDKESRK